MVRAFRRHYMGGSAHNPPSRFLSDIPPELVAQREPAPGEVETAMRGPRRTHRSSQPSAPTEAAFAAGERVRHPRFGDGIVMSCTLAGSDQEVVVVFEGEAGVKKLLLSFAGLERVEA